jgi:hypothetical protein
MSKKNKNRGAKKREKRQQNRRERTKQKRKAHAAEAVTAPSKDSLQGMKRAPPPEFLPGAVLVAGALLPIIAVRWAPAWPAWTFAVTWLASLVVCTVVARALASRRVPKWDPILFFGVGGLMTLLLWSHDSGALWVLNNQDEALTWSVDGGMETQLGPRERARLDLRAGKHVALVGGQPTEFELGPRQRALISHGAERCVLVGSQRFEGEQLTLSEGAPEPVLCPRKKAAPNSATP